MVATLIILQTLSEGLKLYNPDLCALLGAEGEHDVGGDDGAALEEDGGGRGVVLVGHLQHGRVSVHRRLAQQPAPSTNVIVAV